MENKVASGATITSGKKQWPWRMIRLAVSAGLLFWILKNVNWSDFLFLVVKANYFYLGISLGLVLAAVYLSAYKWQRLLITQNVRVSVNRLFVFYLIALFFNNFLPTNIGGDVVRMHDTARFTGKAAESIASVITERLLAALALAITAAVGLIINYQSAQRFSGLIIGVLALTVVLTLIFAVEKIRRPLGKIFRLPNKIDIRLRLSSLGKSMGETLKDRLNVVYVILLSILFQVTVVAVSYFIFLALRVEVPFLYCLLVIPIISAIQMAPISISGFGVREGAYVYFFSSYGVSSTEAIASSLIFWAVVALVSLSGGAIFGLRR